MKIENKIKKKKAFGLQATQVNSGKKYGVLILLILVTLVGIISVMRIGKKAEKTVAIAMLKDGAYKNQMITSDMLQEYDMLEAEYEKYSIVSDHGSPVRRLIRWEDANQAVGMYAAYPILPEMPLERSQLVSSKIDNSDTVMYTFPGKDIIQLDVGSSDLNAFKTFLQPGDRLNIEAIYSDEIPEEVTDSYGNKQTQMVEVFRTETVFGNIMIADLINSNGESVLDIYSHYNNADTWTQASLESSSDWKESVTPTSLLVALSPKEKETYYKYLSKDNIEFRVSLPQRGTR